MPETIFLIWILIFQTHPDDVWKSKLFMSEQACVEARGAMPADSGVTECIRVRIVQKQQEPNS